MMKVIFLDFDGVISTYEKHWILDDSKITILKDIVEKTGAKIVVTSSWKRTSTDTDKFAKSILKDGDSELIRWLSDNIYSLTDSYGDWRGDEVQRWIDAHENEIDGYAILDDDSDYRDNQLFNFIQTDTYEGLTEREAKLCISTLNGEGVVHPMRLNLELITRWRNNCNGIDNNNISQLLLQYYNRTRWKKTTID